MRRRDAFDRDALHFAPFLLLPSPFPAKEFQKALGLQGREMERGERRRVRFEMERGETEFKEKWREERGRGRREMEGDPEQLRKIILTAGLD